MTSLLDVVTNPQALDGYDAIPSLSDVELLECKFSQGLRTLDVTLSLSQLPVRRSNRWADEANAVSMTLQFSDVLACSLNQSHPGAKRVLVSCSFRKNEDGFLFDCSGENLNLRAECNFARITHLSGYLRESGKEIA
jgi:immunity protein 50 of polymorphic toxin system